MNFSPETGTADVAVAIAHNFNYIHRTDYNNDANNNNQQHSTFAEGTKTMEWTNDDALELIEQYRVHTELWNRADPKYKDKLCRFRAWSEIAERFGCSKAEVERKMNVLLTQYRREKHKMLVKLYEGIQPSPSKWYAFKRFDFMEVGGGSGSVIIGAGGNGTGRNSATHLSSHNAELTNGSHSHSQHSHHHGAHQLHGQHQHQHHHQHQHQQHQQHQHAAAAMNGLATFERTTNAVAAAAAAAANAAAAHVQSATTTPTIGTTTSSLHRRMKSKEMKYFGAMGLNLPMLIANSQNMESWSAVGQFSPPIDRSQLRVPMPMSFTASASQPNELNVPNVPGTRSVFGGSSNSDYTASPQKPMDTSDIDDKDDIKPEHHRATPNESLVRNGGTPVSGNTIGVGAPSGGSIVGAGSAGGGSSTRNTESVERDVNSSPIPNTNTNTHEAHRAHTREHLTQQQDDLEIKQELVDYFHAPHPPAPAESQRSYSSTDENRLSTADAEDFAQDLRVTAAAAAAAAAKSLDFSQFVLPRNLRRSTESSSIDEKYTPLNMRKLSANSATGGSSTNQMLMNSLLAHESMSDDTTSGGGTDSAHLKNSTTQETAAAAAALYADCLNKDDCDFIGANVSLKLRTMDRTQRIIAEKLISEVLFYGQFNELERSARIMPK